MKKRHNFYNIFRIVRADHIAYVHGICYDKFIQSISGETAMKYVISVLLSAALLLSAIPAAAVTATPDEAAATNPEALYGDTDGDGYISIQDATLLQYALANSSPGAFAPHWDADGDGKLTINDVTAIQRFCAGYSDCGRTGQHDTPSPLQSLSFEEADVKLGVGEEFPTVLITDGDADKADYSSADPSVASVDKSGVITARGTGETVVSCDCGGLRADCSVRVCPAATSLSLNQTELKLGVGEQYDLDSYVNSGAAAYFRAYSSDDPTVADVAEDGGMVTALSEGTARITCTLQVKPFAPSLSLNASEVTLDVGQSFDFDSYAPSGTAAYYRAYFSENPDIAPVAESGGIVTGNSAGHTRIGCQLQSGFCVYADVTVENGIRNRVLGFLKEQFGNGNRPYVTYYNSHAGGKKVSTGFAWCAVFAWCGIDQCATLLGKRNPVSPCCHVSEIANQARKKGALKNAFSSGYVPQKGDLFTTSTVKSPGTGGRLHIGFVESVETDGKGKVTKVHTIEGNFNWENAYPTSTKVSRSVWTIGKRRYGALLCEYIDIEKLFS